MAGASHGKCPEERNGSGAAARGLGESTVLQTHTVPLRQVRKELEPWKQPLLDEYKSLTEITGALVVTTEKELQKDLRYAQMEVAPAMLVPTVKAPHGKRRARIVICGNRIEAKNPDGQLATEGLHGGPGDSLFANYAGGADGVLLRALLRKTGAKKWQCATVDVKTAFLLAPRRGADNWSTYRNDLLKMWQWDCNGRRLQLLATPEPSWKCSAPEFVTEGAWVKFCGFELSKREINLCWARSPTPRHPGVICKSTPFPGVLDEEPESEVSIQDVRAQGIVGELVWLSCRMRPDLSFGISWMGRMVTRSPRQVCRCGEHMLGYLKSTYDMSPH